MTPEPEPQSSVLTVGKFEGADPRDLCTDDLSVAYRQGNYIDRPLIRAEQARRRVADRRRKLEQLQRSRKAA